MSSQEKAHQFTEGHWPYVLKRSFPIGLATGSVGLGINHYITKKYPDLAKKSAGARSFMVTATFLIGFVTTLEITSLEFERRAMARMNNINIDLEEKKQPELPKTVTDKILDYAHENRFKVFLGAWLGSLGLAGFAVSRDKLMTTSQKVVQARMYAQAFTLLLIVGSAGLAMLEDKNGNGAKHSHVHLDETWRKIIEEGKDEFSKN
ncbi:hypothetical protein V1514DRAFT_300095 [Lipomyces japonicus]|uniref:uncharacterized protein n=1 Tax=Lipomyces japonicus TaxID=56871 RepID=UPI0034CD5A59